MYRWIRIGLELKILIRQGKCYFPRLLILSKINIFFDIREQLIEQMMILRS